jgi:hypothetical protein
MMHIRPINELDPHFHKPWGLLLILWDEDQRKLFGLSNVIDAFEQIMQDPAEKRNLSPHMADCFADLAILSRTLHEIEIYQPWAATFEAERKVSEDFQSLMMETRFSSTRKYHPTRLPLLTIQTTRTTGRKFWKFSKKQPFKSSTWTTWIEY